MSASHWDTLCKGGAAYLDALFPGEGSKLFEVEEQQPLQRYSEQGPAVVADKTKGETAWDKVRTETSAYFDILFPKDSSSESYSSPSRGRRRSVASYSVPSAPAPEKKKGADVQADKAAPSFLEMYLELVFPGEGSRIFEANKPQLTSRQLWARHCAQVRHSTSNQPVVKRRSSTPAALAADAETVPFPLFDAKLPLRKMPPVQSAKEEPDTPSSVSTASNGGFSSDDATDGLTSCTSDNSIAAMAWSDSLDRASLRKAWL